MPYSGDKYTLLNKFGLKSFLYSKWKKGQPFVDLTLGGGSVPGAMAECGVKGQMILSDANFHQVELIREILKGWVPPIVSRELWNDIKEKLNAGIAHLHYSPQLIGWAMMFCSAKCMWMRAYHVPYADIEQNPATYQRSQFNGLVKRIAHIPNNAIIRVMDMFDFEPIEKSFIYADIPYINTTGYKGAGKNKDSFDHPRFWDMARKWTKQGHTVLVSEVNAPLDFQPVWEWNYKLPPDNMGVSKGKGIVKYRHEKLFMYLPQRQFVACLFDRPLTINISDKLSDVA